MSMSAEVSAGNGSSERAAASPSPAAATAGDASDPGAILKRMREAQLREGAPTYKERVRRLDRLERAVVKHQEAIAAAMREDFGAKARAEALMSEVYLVVEGVRHARANLREWMEPESREVAWPLMPAQAEVIPQPVGVVGIVSPWNYPINLALLPLVGALAAGNRAMIKPSETVPKTAEVLATIVREAFEPDVVTVVLGDAKVGETFSRLDFDHLVFTGSTRVGAIVMKAASDNLTPVTLELGGKSPVVFGPDADLKDAAAKVMAGKIWNAGQTCVAPDYLLAPQKSIDKFVENAKKVIGAMLPKLEDNPDYTSIVSDRHYARITGLIEDARDKGARIESLNPAGEAMPAGKRKIAPTLVAGATPDMMIMQEEIFGPVLPMVACETLEEAITFINARPRPLALYYFGNKSADVDRVIDRTRSGGVTVNDTLLHASVDDLPFGGVGASGMGAYHGREGFESFTKWRPVFHQSRLSGRRLLQPPFGKAMDLLLRVLIGR